MDTAYVTKQTFDATRLFVTVVGHDVPVSKKEYMEARCALADKVQNTQRKSKASSPQLSVKEREIEELKLNVRF